MTATSTRVEVGRLDDFQEGVFRIVRVADREIGLIKLPDGQLRAVLNRCPHRGAPVCRGIVGGMWPPCEPGSLRYALDRQVVTCPWHGWAFDLRTGVELFREHPARLRLFETAVEAEIVSVLL